jgi:hypothetical protein
MIRLDAVLCKHCKSHVLPLIEMRRAGTGFMIKPSISIPNWITGLIISVVLLGGIAIYKGESVNSIKNKLSGILPGNVSAEIGNITDKLPSEVVGGAVGKDAPIEYTIRLSGTPGLQFSGSYTTVTPNGESKWLKVEGSVPAEYKSFNEEVSVAFKKVSEDGSLKVQIVRDSAIVSESETSEKNGMVLISAN